MVWRTSSSFGSVCSLGDHRAGLVALSPWRVKGEGRFHPLLVGGPQGLKFSPKNPTLHPQSNVLVCIMKGESIHSFVFEVKCASSEIPAYVYSVLNIDPSRHTHTMSVRTPSRVDVFEVEVQSTKIKRRLLGAQVVKTNTERLYMSPSLESLGVTCVKTAWHEPPGTIQPNIVLCIIPTPKSDHYFGSHSQSHIMHSSDDSDVKMSGGVKPKLRQSPRSLLIKKIKTGLANGKLQLAPGLYEIVTSDVDHILSQSEQSESNLRFFVHTLETPIGSDDSAEFEVPVSESVSIIFT